MKKRLPKNRLKELEDDTRLRRAWRKWNRERLEAAMADAHGAIVGEIVEFLKSMALPSANALLALIRSYDWSEVDAETKFILLHTIDQRIISMREKNGMDAIDDPLPGQPDNVFRIIKTIFGSPHSSAASPGAQSGLQNSRRKDE
jgi:hypothetical protein